MLDGLLEEYNSFVIIKYAKSENFNLTKLESLLMVQEAQLDKFRQELTISNVIAIVARTNTISNLGKQGYPKSGNSRFNYSYDYGRRHYGWGWGHGRARGGCPPTGSGGTRPTCQLCGNY